MKHSGLLLLLGLLLLATGARADVSNTATELQPYQRVAGISGNLSSVGSDTMASLMLLWSQEFNRLYPNVNIQLQAPGSSTAPVALIEGTASLAPMSRPMLERELLAFERRHGYPPTAITVAMDALAIFVHQDNPVAGLNLQQLDAIFSATRRCGGKLRIDRWQQLDPQWRREITEPLREIRYRVRALKAQQPEVEACYRAFHSRVNEQPGSASVVQSVATALNAIGYSSINYRNASVRVLPLARLGNDYVVPEPDSFIDGRYPLARPLYMYINRPPGQPLHPLVREFLHLVLSREGQEVVLKEGYTPLPASAIARQLGKISDVD